MPGPLPSEDRVRRNAPTIPTTHLPVSGRSEPAPEPPKWMELGDKGLAWWSWAWSTPQACAWGPGQETFIARRASLEDVLVATDPDSARYTALCREMREMEDRLGLTPKGMAALRWKIIADPEARISEEDAANVTSITERRSRMLG